jgi:hypothetical protein
MPTRPLPGDYEPAVDFFRCFVLVVTFGPLLFCAGCLGLAVVTSYMTQPPKLTAPWRTPTTSAPGRSVR